MSFRVAILGCGPTGLLAAHACAMQNVEFEVFSKKRKSHLFGSQYLHEPIPGITNHYDKGTPVTYINRGTPEEYRRKTHGKWWDGVVAPQEFEPHHTAWNIREAYDKLWQFYGQDVNDYEIPTSKYAASLVTTDLSLDVLYDLVISTVPRTIWKVPGEEFIYSEGWAVGDAPELGRFCPFTTENDNEIVCDGTNEVSYTRLSRVFGYTTIEWPIASKPPVPGVSKITKPLHYQPSNQVNPTSEWLHVGRYGAWRKGVVVTDAWHEVTKRLKDGR